MSLNYICVGVCFVPGDLTLDRCRPLFLARLDCQCCWVRADCVSMRVWFREGASRGMGGWWLAADRLAVASWSIRRRPHNNYCTRQAIAHHYKESSTTTIRNHQGKLLQTL